MSFRIANAFENKILFSDYSDQERNTLGGFRKEHLKKNRNVLLMFHSL